MCILVICISISLAVHLDLRNHASVLPVVILGHIAHKTILIYLLLLIESLHVGVLLLSNHDLVALGLAKLALVADLSEGEVVIAAPLAHPVTGSLLGFGSLRKNRGVLIG